MAAEIKIDDLSESELQALSERVAERRARLAVEKQKIQGETFDMDDIKPGMSKAELDRAWATVGKAARGDK